MHAAPADEEIHHVHHCVLLRLAGGLTRLLPGALEQVENRFACPAFRDGNLREAAYRGAFPFLRAKIGNFPKGSQNTR